MAWALSVCAALGVGGCAASKVEPTPAFVTDEIARETPTIGKTFWGNNLGGFRLCAKPNAFDRSCELVFGGRVLVEDVEEGTMEDAGGRVRPSHIAYFRVTVDGSKPGYVMVSDLRMHATDIDPAVAAAECKRRGQPRIGMTYAQLVATCWGKPERIDRLKTLGGTRDRLVYGNNRYVQLRDGVVASIQMSGTPK